MDREAETTASFNKWRFALPTRGIRCAVWEQYHDCSYEHILNHSVAPLPPVSNEHASWVRSFAGRSSTCGGG